MSFDLLLKGGVLPDGQIADIAISGGTIAAIEPAIDAYRLAGTQAAALSALEESVSMLRRALSLLAELPSSGGSGSPGASGGSNPPGALNGGFCPPYGPNGSFTALGGKLMMSPSPPPARIVVPLPDSKTAA